MRVAVLKAEDEGVALLLERGLDNIIRFPRKPVVPAEESSASGALGSTVSTSASRVSLGMALEPVLALWAKRAVFQLPADFTLQTTLEVPADTTMVAVTSPEPPKSIDASYQREATTTGLRAAELMSVLDALLAHCVICLSGAKAVQGEGQGGSLRLRASLLHQPQQQERAYHGLSAGEYVLVLFSADGASGQRRAAELDPDLSARVMAFGGEVSCSDQGPLGLQVALHLPIAELSRRDDALDESSIEGEEKRVFHVLLVDDDQQARDVVGESLRRLGCTVMAFADGKSALEALERGDHTFQFVLSDLTMPHMSGAELARRIRRQHPQLPIAMMTGFYRSLEADALEALGVFAVLEKPFGKRALEQLLDAARDEL